MAIDFPNSPTTNDTYTVGSRTWTWTGSNWELKAISIPAGSITTTELADRSIGSAKLTGLTINAQTGTTYTLALSDAHDLVTLSNVSAITLTVPTNAVVGFTIGDQVNLVQLGTGQVTIGGAGVTIRSQGSKLKLNGQYSGATLVKLGTDEWILIGNTAA
jgi:hypothetical protein